VLKSANHYLININIIICKSHYLQEVQSMEHFEQELIEYPDHCSNHRINAKLKGLLSAIHRQQALSAA
jgi:putative transposase